MQILEWEGLIQSLVLVYLFEKDYNATHSHHSTYSTTLLEYLKLKNNKKHVNKRTKVTEKIVFNVS